MASVCGCQAGRLETSFKGITPAIRWYKIRYLVILANNEQAQIVSVKPNGQTAQADARALAEALHLEMVDDIRVKS